MLYIHERLIFSSSGTAISSSKSWILAFLLVLVMVLVLVKVLVFVLGSRLAFG